MRPSIASIQARVCQRFGVSRDAMKSASRKRPVAHPRQVSMVIARALTGRSYNSVGQRHGGRDHTTVIHAERSLCRRRLADPALDLQVRLTMLDVLAPLGEGL